MQDDLHHVGSCLITSLESAETIHVTHYTGRAHDGKVEDGIALWSLAQLHVSLTLSEPLNLLSTNTQPDRQRTQDVECDKLTDTTP